MRETALSGKLTVQLTAQTCTGSSSAGYAGGCLSCSLTLVPLPTYKKKHTTKEKVKALCPTAEILCAKSETTQNLSKYFPPSAPWTGVLSLVQEARLWRSAEEAVQKGEQKLHRRSRCPQNARNNAGLRRAVGVSSPVVVCRVGSPPLCCRMPIMKKVQNT